jgi:peptide-methionine (R)-S-oxide reductase
MKWTLALILTASIFALSALRIATARNTSPTTKPAMKQQSPSAQPSAAAACGLDPDAACGSTHWKEKSEAEWRKQLTPEQYRIAREAGTERAFSGKYWNTHTKGVYHCAICGLPLFSSETKFESGTGWPSFYQPVAKNAVAEHADPSHGMVRTEVQCSQCGVHLGHLFDDGPKPTGLRYCLNSAVLNLVPDPAK